MNKTGWTLAMTGIAATTGLATVVGPIAAGADDADPAVVASRETAAGVTQPSGYQAPPDVESTGTGPVQSGPRPLQYLGDLYYLGAKSTSGGYIEVAARDNPALDKPGPYTTTLRVYGNAAAFRDGPGDLGLNSKFTCSGSGIGGVSIGASGVSLSGGVTSTTLTWPSLRNNSSVLRQYYTEGGHFRCKASNLTFAKFTRRGTASTNYKGADTRAEDSYSFGW